MPFSDEDVFLANLENFVKDRNWGQFHTPKNLVMALTAEVGELNEVVMWLKEDETINLSPERRQNFLEEWADCFTLLMRLSQVLSFDPWDVALQKLKKTIEKYPVETSFGSHEKPKTKGS